MARRAALHHLTFILCMLCACWGAQAMIFVPSMLTPLAGAVWQPGQKVTVTWSTSGLLPIEYGQLLLYVDGSSGPVIQNLVDLTKGTLTFTVPTSTPSRTNYQIGFLGSSAAQRSSTFTIDPPASSSISSSASISSMSSTSIKSSSTKSSSTSSVITASSTQTTSSSTSITSSASASPSMIPPTSDSSNYVGPVVGSIVGAIILLAFIGGLITYIKRRGGIRHNYDRNSFNQLSSVGPGFSLVTPPLPPKFDVEPKGNQLRDVESNGNQPQGGEPKGYQLQDGEFRGYQLRDDGPVTYGSPYVSPQQAYAHPVYANPPTSPPQQRQVAPMYIPPVYTHPTSPPQQRQVALPPSAYPGFSTKHEELGAYDPSRTPAASFGDSSNKYEYNAALPAGQELQTAGKKRWSKPHEF